MNWRQRWRILSRERELDHFSAPVFLLSPSNGGGTMGKGHPKVIGVGFLFPRGVQKLEDILMINVLMIKVRT